MRCVDVNVLVYAHRPESDRHDEYRTWLEAARRADEPLGIGALSYAGELLIGIVADSDACPDIDVLADGITDELEGLLVR